MLDFVLGLALAGMLVRGWIRGFVREVLDLIGLVLGIWIAFRLSTPFGEFIADSFDVAPEVARIGGGIVLFVMFGALLAIAAHFLSRAMNLPGLSMVNRAGGAAVAMGWGVGIVLILVSLASVLPIPQSWRDQLDDSTVVRLIAGEEALPRQVFRTLAGDNVMAAMATIQGIFGSSRAVPVGEETMTIPPAQPDEIRQVREEAATVLGRINEHRVGAGLRAVTEVGVITTLAEDHGAGQYREGVVRRLGDCSANLALRDYHVIRCDNAVALAATGSGGLEGILDTEAGRAMVETADFDRAGVAVVDGPTGRLVVVILAG